MSRSRASHSGRIIGPLAALAVVIGLLALTAPALAAFPGANGKIAFVTDRDEPNPGRCGLTCNWEIYTMNPDGTDQTRLTNTPSVFEREPAWSADGEKIAFQRQAHVWVMNADGSGQTDLGRGEGPFWSPDGQRIAFGIDDTCEPPGLGGPYTMNADGTNRMRLLCNAYRGFRETAWSPDGQTIAFIGGISAADIYTVKPDGSDPKDLTNHPGTSIPPTLRTAPRSPSRPSWAAGRSTR